MDNISNSVTRNQMTFGLVTQKTTLGQKGSHTTGKTHPQSPAHQASTNSLFDSFNVMNDYLEKQELKQKEAKQTETNIFKTQTLERKKPKSHATEELLNSSIFNKKTTQKKEKKQAHNNTPVFNVLSLFKPGELLESISKKEQEKSQKEGLSPFV